MRDFRDSKAIAQTLRDALAAKSIAISHSESLELVAKILGLHDWNELSAKIQSDRQAVTPRTNASAKNSVELPFVPMRDLVLFPGKIAPLWLGRVTSKRAVEHAMLGDKRVVAVAQRKFEVDEPSVSDLYRVGVISELIDVTQLQDKDRTGRIIVKGLERTQILRPIRGQNWIIEVTPIEEIIGVANNAPSIREAVLSKVRILLGLDLSSSFCSRIGHIQEPGLLADAVAPFLPTSFEKAQDILEERNPIDRLKKVLDAMSEHV